MPISPRTRFARRPQCWYWHWAGWRWVGGYVRPSAIPSQGAESEGDFRYEASAGAAAATAEALGRFSGRRVLSSGPGRLGGGRAGGRGCDGNPQGGCRTGRTWLRLTRASRCCKDLWPQPRHPPPRWRAVAEEYSLPPRPLPARRAALPAATLLLPPTQLQHRGLRPHLRQPLPSVAQEPLSTFSIDVDTASYANVRRFLQGGQLPPPDAVRIEELINYFAYDYPPPDGRRTRSRSTSRWPPAPGTPEHRLVRIGLKGKEIRRDERPASNLVFLLDVSGSMQPPNKLPLLKQAMTHAGRAARRATTAWPSSSTPARRAWCCRSTSRRRPGRRSSPRIDRLEAGGSTNGGAGIQLAYEIAREQLHRRAASTA